MTDDEIWTATEAERRSVADLLAGLAPAQWDAPTACDGWRVREVAAHLTVPMRLTIPTTALGLLRARGDFNRFVADDARRRAAELGPDDLVEDLRRLAASRRHPRPTTPMDPFVDILVHGQDIARAVGAQHPIDPALGAAAAAHVWGSTFPFHARKRLAGRRLVATDVDWSAGHGEPIEAPIGDLLLRMTGR